MEFLSSILSATFSEFDGVLAIVATIVGVWATERLWRRRRQDGLDAASRPAADNHINVDVNLQFNGSHLLVDGAGSDNSKSAE